MSEDLTKKLNDSDRDAIMVAIKNLESYVRSSIDNLVTWIGNIDSRLKRLEQRVEERLHDTRPIWHKVVADIGQLQSGQDSLRADVNEIRNTVRDIKANQVVCNDAIGKINREFRTVDERLRRLEVNQRPLNSST